MEGKRSVLITGGTGKIGSVLVRSLLTDGHRVIFTSTSQEKAKALKAALVNFKSRVDYLILKFDPKISTSQLYQSLPFSIDTIIHNARSISTLRILDDGVSDPDDIIEEFNIAVVYPYLIIQGLLKSSHPLKDVIFISSIYGSVGPNRNLYNDLHEESPIQYGVGKAAQIHMVKELAIRLAERRIRVNAISYGGVEGRASQDFVNRYNRLTPSGRMLTDSDLYPAVQFLVNNPNVNITGENLKIDGGWTIW